MNWFSFKCKKKICSIKTRIKHPLKNPEKINSFIFENNFSGLVFFLVVISIFELTFKVGGLIANYIDIIGGTLLNQLHANNIFFVSTISSIFGLLMYLPNIIILYFFLYLLNDSGILKAYSVKFDKFLNKLGISGNGFLSMSLGFGCTVPAILSTKNLPTKEKIIVIMSLPFIPCSAKLPIFVLLISLFIPNNRQSLTLLILYLTGLSFSIISLKIISKIINYRPCIKEQFLNYQIPSIKKIFQKIIEILKEFIFKIGIFVIPITIGLTLLFKLPNGDIQTSYGKQIGEKIAIVFKPLGFNEEMSISIIPGLIGKELIVSTLSNLYSIKKESNNSLIKSYLKKDKSINLKNTISFLVFILLYTTCIGSIITAYKQLGKKLGFLFIIFPFITAYIVSFIVFNTLIFLF